MEGQNVSLAIGMHPIGKQNPKRLREWVHPEGRSGESCVSIRSQREQVSARPAVAGIDVPAQTASRVDGIGALHARHQLHGLAFEEPRPFQFSLIEHHLGKARQVRSGAEQSGVAGHSAHAPGCWIVDCAAQEFGAFFFRRGNSAHTRFFWKKAGIVHFERPVNLLRDENIKGHPAHASNNLAERNKVDVAITKEGAWRIDGLFGAGQLDPLPITGPGCGE